MQDKSLNTLNFDEAVALARQDPEAFEQYRLDAIEALINRSSKDNQQRLRRLQWRIEQERKRAPNPTAACVRIYQMMWDSFVGDKGFVDVICNGNYHGKKGDATAVTAKVLAFTEIRQNA